MGFLNPYSIVKSWFSSRNTHHTAKEPIDYSDMDPIEAETCPESFVIRDNHLVGATATFSKGVAASTTLEFLPDGYSFLRHHY